MKNDKKIPLSTLRKARGLTQKEISIEFGVSSALIAMYETGKRIPSLSKALEIGDFFDMPVESIKFGR